MGDAQAAPNDDPLNSNAPSRSAWVLERDGSLWPDWI